MTTWDKFLAVAWFVPIHLSVVIAQIPEIREEMIYRDNGIFVDGYISSTISLSANGRYSTVVVYHALSKGVWATGHVNIGPNESGTYTYTKGSGQTATLTFSPETPGAISQVGKSRELTFESTAAGTLFVPFAEGMRGNFQLHPRSGSAVVNVSTRGSASSTKPLIVGFVIDAAAGTSRDVFVRGIGPTLRQFDVADAAEDTTLEVVRADGPRSTLNDDWALDPIGVNVPTRGAAAADAVDALGAFVGAFPLARSAKDAAYAVRLGPGAYTLVVRTKAAQPAEVLGEVYVLP